MNYAGEAFVYEVKNDIVCILHERGIIGYGKVFEYSNQGATKGFRLIVDINGGKVFTHIGTYTYIFKDKRIVTNGFKINKSILKFVMNEFSSYYLLNEIFERSYKFRNLSPNSALWHQI